MKKSNTSGKAFLNDTQKRKKRKGKCIELYCRNDAAQRANYCHKCIQRKWRAKNPIKYIYNRLKDRSRKRGQSFDLKFEELVEFLNDNPAYFKFKGTTKSSLQIDRIDISKGYSKGNLQVITQEENIRKQHLVDYPTEEVPF